MNAYGHSHVNTALGVRAGVAKGFLCRVGAVPMQAAFTFTGPK
jgi:hypothetical protein